MECAFAIFVFSLKKTKIAVFLVDLYFPCGWCSTFFDPAHCLLLDSGMSTRYGFGGLEWNPTDLEGSDGAEVVFVHIP